MNYKLILYILIFFSWVYAINNVSMIRLESGLNNVKGISSKDKILFTADFDDSGCVHLIYIIDRDNTFFLKFNPRNKSISAPVKLPINPGNSSYKRFSLFTKKQKDYFYWWDKGLNRLIIDCSEKDLKTAYSKLLPSIPLADFRLKISAEKLWLTYSNKSGIFLRKSSNMGQSWSDVIPVYSFSDDESLTSIPEISIQMNITYLTFSILCKKTLLDGKTKSIPKIVVMSGSNEGESWSKPFCVKTFRQNATVFQHPQIIYRQNQLHLFYSERGIKYQHSEQKLLDFSIPTDITKISSSYFKTHAFKEGFLLLWIDTRYRKKEWWSYIPLHQMFTWDKDPYWANNDFFLMYYSKKVIKAFILSPHNSYAVPSQSSVKLIESELNIIILWSGLSKIGKTLKDSSVPYSIFYSILPKSKFLEK